MTNDANYGTSGGQCGSAWDFGCALAAAGPRASQAADGRRLDTALAEDVLDVLQIIVVGGLRGLAGGLGGRLGLAGGGNLRPGRGHPSGRRRGAPSQGVTAAVSGRHLGVAVLSAPGGLALVPGGP